MFSVRRVEQLKFLFQHVNAFTKKKNHPLNRGENTNSAEVGG